ncbi:unnamed protein product [marine sediment metagenome]|uniref:Molybdopterin dinucleotide-binding domain-containing protein n=1 Tax=marine sediment metagenome TaxID=412755 RepID=X1BQV5_9ZZZZ
MDFLLNTIRKIDNDQVKEHSFGNEQSLEENLAISFINPKDFDKLNLVASLHLKISNKQRNVVVKFEKDDNVPEKTITMPVSIWSNQLTEILNDELLMIPTVFASASSHDALINSLFFRIIGPVILF